MSNSIWKTTDHKPDKSCPIVFRNDIGVIYCALEPKSAFLMRSDHKWAYLHEVVAQADKAERLQKAVDLAVNALKSAGTHNSINCIARGDDPVKDDVGTTINSALNKIKQLIKD